jgi:glycosyltransferase involved in cell wall biosynthesis
VADTVELSVVMPVYDEGLNIEKTLQSLKANVPVPHEVIIVYDRDEDSTLPVVRPLMPSYEGLRLVRNSVAPGPSGALRTGFVQAKASRVLVVMADLCDDFSQIPLLLSLVPARADIACPSRYCEGGAQQLKPSLKVWAPKFAGRLLRGLTGIPTYDPTNSFKLYSAAVLRDLVLTSTVSFSVTLEIVAKAHCLGYRIVELPTVWADRQHGKSNFNLRRSLFAYSPWFCAAMLRSRLLRIPQSWLRWLFTSEGRCARNPAHKPVVTDD